MVSSISPGGGSAGQTVTISGSNLYSPNTQQIAVHFGGETAPISCPTQTSCTVTVPSLPGSPSSVPVTITTQSGTSAPLTFTYG